MTLKSYIAFLQHLLKVLQEHNVAFEGQGMTLKSYIAFLQHLEKVLPPAVDLRGGEQGWRAYTGNVYHGVHPSPEAAVADLLKTAFPGIKEDAISK